MSEKHSIYDTDPLDAEFARQKDEMWGATRGMEPRPTNEAGGLNPQPEQARMPLPSEAPTQRMNEHFAQSYPSVFIPPTYPQSPQPYQQSPPPVPQYQQQPAQYQQPYTPPMVGTGSAPERHIAGLNIAEKYAVVLPYAPFFIGIVVAIIELLMVPRREVRVRFHAAQGLALQLAILALGYLFTFLGFISGSSRAGGGLVRFAGFVFLIISMIRVWKGVEHRIGPLSDATKWLNERIDPRKS